MKGILVRPGSKVRFVVMLPFTAVLVSGAGLLIAAAGSYGVADHVGYGSWVPPAGGLILALPLILAAFICGAIVWDVTSRLFRLTPLRLAPGWLYFAVLAAMQVAYILTIDNPTSYEGRYDPLTGRWEPNFTLETFLAASVGLSLVLLAMAYLAMRFSYLPGVQRPGLAAPEGVDPIGALIRERTAR
jgi:hypothetical protein